MKFHFSQNDNNSKKQFPVRVFHVNINKILPSHQIENISFRSK